MLLCYIFIKINGYTARGFVKRINIDLKISRAIGYRVSYIARLWLGSSVYDWVFSKIVVMVQPFKVIIIGSTVKKKYKNITLLNIEDD